MAANGYRPSTPRQLADDEQRMDRARGRRHCRVHPQQQMMPLLAGVDVCPVCPGESQRPPQPEHPRPERRHPRRHRPCGRGRGARTGHRLPSPLPHFRAPHGRAPVTSTLSRPARSRPARRTPHHCRSTPTRSRVADRPCPGRPHRPPAPTATLPSTPGSSAARTGQKLTALVAFRSTAFSINALLHLSRQRRPNRQPDALWRLATTAAPSCC